MEGTSNMGSSEEQFQPDTCLTLFKYGEEGSDSRSRSETAGDQEGKDVGAGAGAGDERSSKRTKHHRHRHSSEQIHKLEGSFRGCPHPTEEQRLELSKKLGLETSQVKFWFQNRRTQLKTQMERHEKTVLKQEYDRLKKEVIAMKESIGNPQCKECGASVSGEIPRNEQQIRMENARLKEELTRVRGMLENLMAIPTSKVANSITRLEIGNIVPLELSVGRSDIAAGLSLGGSNPVGGVKPGNGIALASSSLGVVSSEYQDSIYLQGAVDAMNELIVLAKNDSPFWLKSLDGKRETFDEKKYRRKFNYQGANPSGFVSEATRATGLVVNTRAKLMNTMMDPIRWAEMFPSMIGRASVVEVLCGGVEGTHDGELLMMTAELVFPSPLVPLRHIRFIRYCKQHSNGTWAVVDVSVDPAREDYADVDRRCRKLPSGCLVKDLPNGYSLVTFMEHSEYDEFTVHRLFRPLMQSGLCYGAERWLATLQRQCECSAYLTAPNQPNMHIGFPNVASVEGIK